jgi:hypothetical protein
LNGGSGLRISDQMPCLTVNFELATAVFPGTGWIKTEHSPANDGFDGNDVPRIVGNHVRRKKIDRLRRVKTG